ncbi:hypothetical protein [Undibacterium curvum]|uniref:hypothetical protein n=1 Tax=Undibacterium curvum TaxID=2762294 RepID=UPI003D140FD4
MNLLRYYFQVGGEKFDAENFSLAALKNGLEQGTVQTVSNIKKLKRRGTSGEVEVVEVKILPGLTGANGDAFTCWSSARIDYATDKDQYIANHSFGLSTDTAQLWLREEITLLSFLRLIKERLPRVSDFCDGEFFLLMKLVYGYDEADGSGGGFHYSEVLMKNLCELNAGLSTDSEPFELHFSRRLSV